MQPAYIGAMNQDSKGPVEAEIEKRVTAALNPSHLRVINDSAQHHGHAGDDGSGESHFTVEIVAAQFEEMNRVERQRAVNRALGDLMKERVHAMQIRAKAPSEVAE